MDIFSSPPKPTRCGLAFGLRLASLLIVAGVLSGCGNKGPLVPPKALVTKSVLAEPRMHAPSSGQSMIDRAEARE
ncbi:MAG: LPS translocon maturation chaperone LptM [Casimicrobiaceae bacterium]